MKNIRGKLLLVCGLILLSIFNKAILHAAICGCGEGDLGNARVCFDRHELLKSRLKSADGGQKLTNNIVQISLKNYPAISAVALLDRGQACVVKINPKVRSLYMNNEGVLNSRFLNNIIGHSIDRISTIAKDDCVIEVNKLADNITFSVIDFVNQSMVDGINDGLIIIDSENQSEVKTKDILYLQHVTSYYFDKFIWEHDAFISVVKESQNSNIYQMGRNGIVTKENDSFYATYILNGKDYIKSRVCSSEELKNRYREVGRKPTGALSKLVESSDSEIARRAIPGIWYLQLNIEAAAYVFCK